MSDDPKKKSEAAGKKKGSSSGSAKPDVFSLQNSEPSSNPIPLSTLGKSSGNDKKIESGPKAVLPGSVAQSTSASKGKSMPTQNMLTEFVSGVEGTKGSNYHRSTVTTPKFISEPIVATKERVFSSRAENEAKSQNKTSATTTSLNNSEPSALPVTVKSSKSDKKMKIGTNSVLPGAVAETAAPDEGSKGNKDQRKIAASSVNSKATDTEKIRTNSVLPVVVADSGAPDEGFKGNKYQRKVAASSVNSKATGHKKSSSTTNQSTTNETTSSFSGNFAYNEGAVSTFTSLENSEPSALPSSVKSSEADKKMKIGTSAFPDFISESYSSNAYNGQQPFDAEAHNETSAPSSEQEPLEILQDNAQYISQDNSYTHDTQELVVAILVESNKNILGTDVIVDAIVVDDKPTTWYKDRRTLLIVGIIVVVAVSITVFVTVLLLDERNDESPAVESMAPSTMPSEAPTLSPSPRILRAMYDSTNGPFWFRNWDFSSGKSYCEFYGITCDDSEQITSIYLPQNNLQGSLTSEIGMLSSLIFLNLEYNSITGTIPSEIGMLSSLTRFDLFLNSITGTIPSEIGMLLSLTDLDLDDNSITGTIPTEIGMLPSLEYLYLWFNSITSTIPSEIGMLSSLTWLDLESNSVTGTMPSEIGMLSSLVQLRLRFNSITGMIPSELCALTNTTILYDASEISCTCIDSIYGERSICN